MSVTARPSPRCRQPARRRWKQSRATSPTRPSYRGDVHRQRRDDAVGLHRRRHLRRRRCQDGQRRIDVRHVTREGDDVAAILQRIFLDVGPADPADGLGPLRLERQPLVDVGHVVGDNDLGHRQGSFPQDAGEFRRPRSSSSPTERDPPRSPILSQTSGATAPRPAPTPGGPDADARAAGRRHGDELARAVNASAG